MKEGKYTDIDIEDYHSNMEWFSSTMLRQAAESPRHLEWYIKNRDEERKSHFDFGNAFELALLDQMGFVDKVAILNDSNIIKKIEEERPEIKQPTATKDYREWKNDFYATNESKYIIPHSGPESYEIIEQMLESCYRDKVIQGLIKGISYQHSLFWKDKTTGLQLKTRPDICKINKNVVVDVKTSRNGSPDHFGRDIANHKLHIQAIMQIDGVISTGLMPSVDAYFWLVVEKEPPYNATLYEFSDWQQEESIEEYRSLLSTIKAVQDSGVWTGYSQWADNKYGILPAPIKPWTFKNYSYD